MGSSLGAAHPECRCTEGLKHAGCVAHRQALRRQEWHHEVLQGDGVDALTW